jgi:hypothetical protein
MENRHLPILHKKILLRVLCVSNESRQGRDEWAVKGKGSLKEVTAGPI